MRTLRQNEEKWIELQSTLERLAKEGLSAGRIKKWFAEFMDVDVTRNMIIGRCDRTGITLKGKKCLPLLGGKLRTICRAKLHPLTDDNLLLRKKKEGRIVRLCKKCEQARNSAWRKRRRDAQTQERQAA